MAFYFISSPLKERDSHKSTYATHKTSVNQWEVSNQQGFTDCYKNNKLFEQSAVFFPEGRIELFRTSFKEKIGLFHNSKQDKIYYHKLFYRPPPFI
jgi:hypothetical protein